MKKLLINVALIVLAGSAMAQDAMKVIKPEDLVWKEHPVFKGAQIVILVGDPTKAETIVQRVKFPPNFKVPPHTHPYSEVVTGLSGTYWNAMGDDTEKGVPLKPGSVFVLPANHTHHTWTTDEEVILQIYFTGAREVLPSLIRLTIREKSKGGKMTRHTTTVMPPPSPRSSRRTRFM